MYLLSKKNDTEIDNSIETHLIDTEKYINIQLLLHKVHHQKRLNYLALYPFEEILFGTISDKKNNIKNIAKWCISIIHIL